MKPVSSFEQYTDQKPARKWPFITLIVLDVLLLAGCLVAFWFTDGAKYERAVAYVQAGDYLKADRYAQVLRSSREELPQLQSLIDAGVLMNMGAYDESRRMLGELGDYLNAQELYKECTYRYGYRLYELERYEEARELFLELGNYQDSQFWADECACCIGLVYYNKLADATDPELILGYAADTIKWFSSVTDHETAEEMLRRTSSYIYSLGEEAFSSASSLYNAVSQPAADVPAQEDETGALQPREAGGDTTGDTPADPPAQGGDTGDAATPPATPDATQDVYTSMLEDARAYFEMIPTYMDSQTYLTLIEIELNSVSEEDTALKLRTELWDFAPARKYILGKYIPYFFRGDWTDGSYIYAISEHFHFYMLRPGDGSGTDYGAGGFSINTRNGWKEAGLFRIFGADSIEWSSNNRVYTLTRSATAAAEPQQLGQEDAGTQAST